MSITLQATTKAKRKGRAIVHLTAGVALCWSETLSFYIKCKQPGSSIYFNFQKVNSDLSSHRPLFLTALF